MKSIEIDVVHKHITVIVHRGDRRTSFPLALNATIQTLIYATHFHAKKHTEGATLLFKGETQYLWSTLLDLMLYIACCVVKVVLTLVLLCVRLSSRPLSYRFSV